jgi:3-oxoacyl-[acyl-carrier protein] reductase
MNLQGKVVLVTGASRGIGKAIALKFAEYGASVCINYLNNDSKAQEVQDELRKYNVPSLLLKGSVASLAYVKEMFAAVKKELEHIDILVNNAGITKDGFLMTMKEEQWDNVVNTNLKGVYNCCKTVLPLMIGNKAGKIINISSVAALSGTVGQTSYAATKAGIIGLTKSLAKETAKFNIQVNAVAPGFIDTDMVSSIPARMQEKYIDSIPVKRWGTAEEVAEIVAFLASNRSDYILGQTIVIDGGLTC